MYIYVITNLLTPYSKESPFKSEGINFFTCNPMEASLPVDFNKNQEFLMQFEGKRFTFVTIDPKISETGTEAINLLLYSVSLLKNQYIRFHIIMSFDGFHWCYNVPLSLINPYTNEEKKILIREFLPQDYIKVEFELCNIALPHLFKKLENVKRNHLDTYNRISRSIKFLQDYSEQLSVVHNFGEALLKLMISYEALLNFRDEKIFRSIKKRIRYITGSDFKKDDYSKLYTSYKHRSSYVHTGDIASCTSIYIHHFSILVSMINRTILIIISDPMKLEQSKKIV